jgi:hypothetical protein
MKCGHATYATFEPDGTPYCPIDSCSEVAKEPNLEGREAKCVVCSRKKPSSFKLPFFQYREGKEHDWMYCGCDGFE